MTGKILIFLYVLTTSAALVALKWGSKDSAIAQFADQRLHFNLNPFVITGVALYGLSFALYTYLISKYDLGYIIPLTTAFVYVVIFVASFFVFHENFGTLKIAGIVLIISGIVLLNINK